jgi:hypothetical protein
MEKNDDSIAFAPRKTRRPWRFIMVVGVQESTNCSKLVPGNEWIRDVVRYTNGVNIFDSDGHYISVSHLKNVNIGELLTPGIVCQCECAQAR